MREKDDEETVTNRTISQAEVSTRFDNTHSGTIPRDAPDGGKDAWLVLLGSVLAMLASFGIVNSYVRPTSRLWFWPEYSGW